MKSIVGAQMYPWFQHLSEQGKSVEDHLDELLGTLRAAGVDAYETTIPDQAAADHIAPLLAKHQIAMPSTYCGGTLHTDAWKAGVAGIVAQAAVARTLGANVVVVNPDPIDWSGKTAKTDSQLRTQLTAMRELNAALAAQGQRLAYHVHTPELLHGAREMHHMLLSVPDMGVCLDAHWVYRGAGDSHVALEDFVKLYGHRTVSMHVRQSQGGVWAEGVGEGDLDYAWVAGVLLGYGFAGPIILEAAFDPETPRTLTMEENHRRSAAYVRTLFHA